MSIDNDNSNNIIPRVVTVFRHLLFANMQDAVKKHHAEKDVADKILDWVEREELDLIKAAREQIKNDLKKDGGATLTHNEE